MIDTNPIGAFNAMASVYSDGGYLRFLDSVMVDAQPKKRLFCDIAEDWQWERAYRSADAIDHLCGVKDGYTGPRSFWEEYHKGSDKTHEDARQLLYILGWSTRALNCYVCAGSEDQASLITTAMRGICRDNQWIADRVDVSALGARGSSGSTLTVLPKNAHTGQGIFPDFVIASEVTHWLHDSGYDLWMFILESVNKRPDCVLKVETNAGLKGGWQWSERERIRKGVEERAATGDRQYWSFYSAPVGKPLPTWMDQAKIDDDSQGLTPGERDRLYRNRWVDPGEEHGYLTEAESLLCRDLTLVERTHGEPYLEYFAIVDYGGVTDRCACAVMHPVPTTDCAVVDRLDCWQGTHEDRIAIDYDELRPRERSVEGWLRTVLKTFKRVTIVVDPHQLEGLAIKYERRGWGVERFEYRGGKGNYRLAQLLKTSVQNRKVSWSQWAGLLPPSFVENGRQRYIEDRTLEQELGGLVTRPMSYGYRFDHEAGRHDDRCLVANTLVETQYGPKFIDNVRKGELVLTRRGWREVLWAGATGYKPTLEVTFSNGTTLRGTGNHPILNECGEWVCIDDLEVGDLAWSLSKSLSTLDGPTDVTRTRNGVITASTSHVTTSGSPHLDTFTAICGSTPTDQSPRDTTYTIRTTTPSTTYSRTLSALRDNNTTRNTATLTERSGEYGYKPYRVKRTASNPLEISEDGKSGQLVKSYREWLRSRGKIAQLRQFDVLYAMFLSSRTAQQSQCSVLRGANNAPSANAVRVVSIKQCDPTTVYDLTVDEEHEFFANGILVHNCTVVGMGLMYCLPNALPEGSTGPKTVTADAKDGYRPPGVVPTNRQKDTSSVSAIRQWGILGMNSDRDDDWLN